MASLAAKVRTGKETVEANMDERRKERISMAKEICSHRGENPYAVDRGGNEGWEKYEPLAGACIREAERLLALRETAPGVREAYEQAALVVERWSLPTIQTPSMWLVDKAGIAADIRALTVTNGDRGGAT